MPNTPNLQKLRFPIGQFQKPANIDRLQIAQWIAEIAALPQQLRQATNNASDATLDTPYRPDGWTVRQVVHHIADSHINSYTRFKLALTEDNAAIRPYFEERWAMLPDSKAPIEISLQLLEALHERWVILLKSLTTEQLKRTFVHPEHGAIFALDENIGVYAWHGKHHLAHIQLVTQK